MSKKRNRGNKAPAHTTPTTDCLPPESSPSKYYSRFLLSDANGGSGPLCMVHRELQLVWYKRKKDRDKNRNGKLVCTLEFQDCQRQRDHRGERYLFTGLLLEDMSGEYWTWLGHQKHKGRSVSEGTAVLETPVEFSVAVSETTERTLGVDSPPVRPFTLHHPDAGSLSSPQIDMLFDAMSFLYQHIPAIKRMESLEAEYSAEHREELVAR